jgi:alcohol dehydrogenase
MKTTAAVLEAIREPLRVQELDLDAPGPGELLVRVEAAGICHSDLSVVDGTRPRPTPMVLGHEAAGVVEAVGPGVGDVAEGDHVVLTFVPSCGTCGECAGGRPAACGPAAAANGEGRLLGGGRRFHRGSDDLHHHLGVSAFSQRTVVSRGSAVVIAPDVPFATAALFGCGVLTGVGAALYTAGVRPGDSAAVFGLGGVGLSAVMGCSLAGAYPLYAIDPVPSKQALALELGATAAFHPDELADTRVDHAFEAVGSARVLEAAYRATARGGNTVSIGLPHPDQVFSVPAVSIVAEARSILGSYLGSAVPQRDIPRLITLWRGGRLPVEKLQAGTLGLDAINEGFDALARGEVVRQIVTPWA